MRGLNGSPQDLVFGASGVAASKSEQDNWPYWWLFPRKENRTRQPFASIPTPAPGVLTEVMEFSIPSGFLFVLRGIRHNFFTSASPSPFVDGSGDILWTLDVDSPVGAIALSGYALPDFSGMADERGSKLGPWPLDGYAVFDEYHVLRYKVLTTNVIPAGSPNFITCGLSGYLVEVY